VQFSSLASLVSYQLQDLLLLVGRLELLGQQGLLELIYIKILLLKFRLHARLELLPLLKALKRAQGLELLWTWRLVLVEGQRCLVQLVVGNGQ
jgi:hypothetical protein